MREKTATEKSVAVFVIYGKYFLQIYAINVMMSKMEYYKWTLDRMKCI